MYLSYLDESGTPADKATRFFVLGGVMVFERQTHWLERELEAIADRYQQKTGGIWNCMRGRCAMARRAGSC